MNFDMLDIIFTHSYLSYFFIILLGLIFGSFFNVIIYRLPIMLEKSWAEECESFLKISSKTRKTKTFNIIYPRSQCPYCHQTIKMFDNIPLISFLFLNGKCRNCHNKINWRYPFIELLTAFIFLISVFIFGFSVSAFCVIIFAAYLIILSVIDLDKQILPDILTLQLLWLGLFINCFNIFTSPVAAIFGAFSGYLFLWGINQIFKAIRKVDGMGYGDFKLFAALGAWLGWQLLPLIILIASFTGAIVGLIGIIAFHNKTRKPIPFGPFLAFSGWIAMLWGQQIVSWYLT